MNYKEQLIYIYNEAKQENCYRLKLSEKVLKNIKIIAEKCFNQNGCQIIINGVILSLKYYLRLISSLDRFTLYITAFPHKSSARL